MAGTADASPSGAAARDRAEMLEVLRANRGFDEPEAWLDYALAHDFRRVAATALPRCPDCGGGPVEDVGQFVWYSNLVRLRRCGDCDLVYADARVDPDVIGAHFETAYKDETYFRERRRAIFEDLAERVDRLAPPGGAVLDVGGAKGHLMAAVAARRSDLALHVNDVSETALRWAAAEYGLETVSGPASALAAAGRRFHVVVLADVLYYEPDLAGFWRALPDLLEPAGALVLRIPNRSAWIRGLGRLGRRRPDRRTRVRLFNPEHLYVFSRRYLHRRLRGLGFRRVAFEPSPPLSGPTPAWLGAGSIGMARMLHRASGGRWVVTPSLVATASQRR